VTEANQPFFELPASNALIKDLCHGFSAPIDAVSFHVRAAPLATVDVRALATSSTLLTWLVPTRTKENTADTRSGVGAAVPQAGAVKSVLSLKVLQLINRVLIAGVPRFSQITSWMNKTDGDLV
jgi:hypothetical protein